MTTYKTAVEFGTNVGVLERDYRRAQSASQVFGEQATRDLQAVTVADDKLALASQRVVAAQNQLVASRERLNAVMASGVATQRELATAQAGFVASQERLLVAQAKQAELARVQVAAAPRRGGGSFGGIAGLIGGLAATEGALKIKDAVENGVRAASQLQAIDRQVNVSLGSTGNVANTSAEHIDKVAESLARTTGIMPNTIAGGQLLELTFTGIRNEGAGANAVFDRTAQTAANMAIGLHLARGSAIDYQGSMQLLARALNDPIAGMATLRRAGVQFTAQQRDQITALAKNGQLLQAQSLILDLVNKKFGDAAAQFGQGAEGGLARGRVALEEFEKALASPALVAGVPILHALTNTLTFMSAHPITIWAAEGTVALTGLVFAVASLEHAMAFLRDSQWISALGRWLFSYRSLGRTVTTLASEEEAQAVAATRAAEAENVHAAAMERSTIAARELAAAEAQAAGAGAAGGGSWLRRLLGRSAPVAEGAAGGAGGGFLGALSALALPIAATVVGAGSVALGVSGAGRYSRGQDLIDQLLQAQSQTKGAYSDPRFARVISELQTPTGPLGLGGISGKAFSDASKLLNDVATGYGRYAHTVRDSYDDFMTAGRLHMLLAQHYAAERDAIYQTDLADANTSQKRADRLAKAYRDAKTFQHQVVAGNAKAIQSIEQMIGVSAPALFDLVNPNDTAAKAASTASGVRSAQVSSTSAQRSVSLAEARLTALRATGKATDLQLQSAETSLANARDRARLSSDRLTAAEKKAHDARSQSLTVADVLKRAEDQTANGQAQAAAARRLVDLGVTEPVMQGLLALDQQAPGTFVRIAAHLTQAGADKLNHDERVKDAARRMLEKAFAHSNTKDAEQAAGHAADRAAQAWQTAYLAALKDPKFWDLVNTDLGQLLIANQGVLPKGSTGATGTGDHGKAPSVGDVLRSGLPKASQLLPHGLSADVSSRAPIGVQLGVTSGTATPNVVVHVHTAAPQYHVRHEVKVGEVRAHDYHDFQRQLNDDARTRASMP